MKRSQMNKKVNRRTKFFNHVNRNVVYPTIFFNPNLEEGNKSAVEITELNSDEDVSENEQRDIDRCNNHSWCNINIGSEEQGDDYKVNRSARDKRRQNNENGNHENFTRSKYNDEDVLNQFCTDFYGIDCYDRGGSIPTVKNPYSEFVTIIKNRGTSETSSDSNQYDNVEVIQCDETKENEHWNSNDFYDRNVTYDNGNAEKRTIWIYALKNQRYLSEHDYELVNISSKDSISTTDDEEPSKDMPNSRRIATPIPTYIPRMNLPLSPMLPTVTEVTEPIKQASNNSDIRSRNADKNHFQRPSSGWFKDEINNTRNNEHSQANIEKSFENNWQALSPRERRRLKQSKINEQNNFNTNKDPETPIYCEPTIIVRNKEFSPESHVESFEKQIDEIEINGDDQANGTNDKKEVVENSRDNFTLNVSLSNLQKPQIKLNTELKTLKKDITDPIENLYGNWIGQPLPDDDELLEVYNYNVSSSEDNDAQVGAPSQRIGGGAGEESASDRLFIRSMSLLKPAEWTQYLPFTGSVPSLHLSISVDTDFDTEKKSWFKRFLHIVNCCK